MVRLYGLGLDPIYIPIQQGDAAQEWHEAAVF